MKDVTFTDTYGFGLVFSCNKTGVRIEADDVFIVDRDFENPKDVRRMAEFLLKAADVMEGK